MFACLRSHPRIHCGRFRCFRKRRGGRRILATQERQFTLQVECLWRTSRQFEHFCRGLRRCGIVSGLCLRHSQSPQRY